MTQAQIQQAREKPCGSANTHSSVEGFWERILQGQLLHLKSMLLWGLFCDRKGDEVKGSWF